MKRMSMILMACLMVLGMSQCKKENQNASTEPEGVKITLTVDNGGERVAVTPGETVSTVTFEDGDVILVADDQHYLGSLSRTNGAFTGTVTQPGTDHLHFFFAGNKVAPSSLTPGTSTGCTVDMSDQSDGPAVVSYASMAYDGSSSVTASVKLLNKASGLVKFTTNIGTTNDITIAGVYNKMNITFGAEPTIATDQTERGTIKLNRYTGDNDNKTFLAVIPEQSGVNGASVTVTGFTADNIDIPPVTESMNGAMSITLTAAAPSYTFTIDNSGATVEFAPGNLQYQASTNTWRFAEHQYDYKGAWNPSSDWVDLFGWGTWGEGKDPLNESEDGCDYEWITDFNGTLDGHSDWFTLSGEQWQYILDNSTHGMATITKGNDDYVYGIVILPNNSTLSISDEYTVIEWTNNMEAYGAVFLPAAGVRYMKLVDEAGDRGDYWSSSASDICEDGAWYVLFNASNWGTVYDAEDEDDDNRGVGRSVRLVREL
jgi:hypothetical protein